MMAEWDGKRDSEGLRGEAEYIADCGDAGARCGARVIIYSRVVRLEVLYDHDIQSNKYVTIHIT